MDLTGFYLRLEALHSPSELPSGSVFFSSLPTSTFWEDLFSFNNEYTHNFDNRQKQLGVFMRLMLPDEHVAGKKLSDDELILLIRKFSNKLLGTGKGPTYQELPFCVYKSHAGMCEYLDFYISDRYYDENGLDWIEYYYRDYYVNKDTGRLCSKKDENAVISHHKGEYRTTYKRQFSKKNTMFMTNYSKFNTLVNSIKEIYFNVLDEIVVRIDNTCKVQKMSREKARNKYQQRNITKINLYANKCENELREVYEVLNAGYFWNDLQCRDDFFRIRQKIRTVFINESYKPHKKLPSVSISMNTYWEHLDSYLDDFYRIVSNLINRFIHVWIVGDLNEKVFA